MVGEIFVAIGFVPFLTDILSRVISVLPHIKTDTCRYVWAHALRAFCESVREYASASNITRTEYDDKCSGDGNTENEQVMFYKHSGVKVLYFEE